MLQRSNMRVDELVEGPCIIEESYTSTIIVAGQTVHLDQFMNLRAQKTGVSVT